MKYVLAAIAAIWIVDGLSLVVAPTLVITKMREVLALSPKILKWEGLATLLGIILVLGTHDIPYQPLWALVGAAMIIKGLFLALGPEPWRHRVLEWCLRREEIDYRFWGLGLCALALVMLHALGWFQAS